jgi:GT2 family glycosyltransferase
VVFTDCGCLPEPTWARELIAPILDRAESVTVGRTVGRGPTNLYRSTETSTSTYLAECPTINVAFSRAAFDAVAGFDESFAYGSDIDFSWRLVAAGHRLRSVPQAVISVNWGNPRRQIRRAWLYGRARARLYRKHPARARSAWRTDPVPFAYGLFLLGLPLTLFIPVYPLLLILPVARNRDEPALLMLLDHILNGAGFLRGMLD